MTSRALQHESFRQRNSRAIDFTLNFTLKSEEQSFCSKLLFKLNKCRLNFRLHNLAASALRNARKAS